MDLSSLCIHTITNRPWDLEACLKAYSDSGIGGVSIWQHSIEPMGAKKAAQMIRQFPIQVVSYVRGGFFPNIDHQARKNVIDKNKTLIEEASMIGAPLLVMVCGADPRQSMAISRQQIQEAIQELAPFAADHGVKLGIEPLHPMYADTRSAINTLEQANDMAEEIACPSVGVVVDVYHLWWESKLEQEIKRCGAQGNLFAYHICDWKSPTTDMLNDRGLMGEGCIPLKQIKNWVQSAGFDGFHEVEIFSDIYWKMDQDDFLQSIIKAYLNNC